MKKTYQEPKTHAVVVRPQSILCASGQNGGTKIVPFGNAIWNKTYGD